MSIASPVHGGGRKRSYTAEELALFAEYVGRRRACQPAECVGGAECWVEKGPPMYSMTASLGRCVGCNGKVRE